MFKYVIEVADERGCIIAARRKTSSIHDGFTVIPNGKLDFGSVCDVTVYSNCINGHSAANFWEINNLRILDPETSEFTDSFETTNVDLFSAEDCEHCLSGSSKGPCVIKTEVTTSGKLLSVCQTTGCDHSNDPGWEFCPYEDEWYKISEQHQED